MSVFSSAIMPRFLSAGSIDCRYFLATKRATAKPKVEHAHDEKTQTY